MVDFTHGLLVALFWMIVSKIFFYNNLDLLQSSIDNVGTQWTRNKQHSRQKVHVREAITKFTECPKLVLKMSCKIYHQQKYILLAEAKIEELI